jgi:hypothetical protein
MEPNFSYIASSLTTEELNERINNRKKYLPETVEAAVAELQYRKRDFSNEELRDITESVQMQRKNAALVDSRLGLFNNSAKNVIVKDPEAPLMYSRQALRVFTVLCGALFGSIMMAINISKTKHHSKAIWVVVFGIVFTAVQIFVVSKMPNPNSGSSGAILGGLIAAFLLDYFFWKPFIGYATFYRARPIWIPLIVALVIFGLIIALIIIGGKAG